MLQKYNIGRINLNIIKYGTCQGIECAATPPSIPPIMFNIYKYNMYVVRFVNASPKLNIIVIL